MPIWDVIERNMMRSGFRPNAVPFPVQGNDGAVDETTRIPMLVITSESMDKGSYAIVDTDLLTGVSDGFEIVGGDGAGELCGPDLIIIPSSTNEILVLPIRSSSELDSELETIRAMVSEVNRTNVSLDEWLSNSVYIFERETGEVRIA